MFFNQIIKKIINTCLLDWQYDLCDINIYWIFNIIKQKVLNIGINYLKISNNSQNTYISTVSMSPIKFY